MDRSPTNGGPGFPQSVTPQLLPRLFQILTGILLGLAVAIWILAPWDGRERGSGDGYFLPEAMIAPDFTLTSQEGSLVSLQDLRGKLLAVFFGYTSCPDVCPLTLANLSRAAGLMGESARNLQVILITVDPDRDTPRRLGEYLSPFHPSVLGLTGTEEEIRAVAEGFGVYFARAGEGEHYTVDHTARVFVVTPEGKIPLTFPTSATPGEMARDLGILLESLS